jgi:hypothetical protein
MIMDEQNVGGTVEVADPQINTTNTDTTNTGTEVTSEGNNSDVANQTPPKQDDKTNSAFAEMRRQKEALERETSQVKRDYEIAKKYSKEYGIYSESDIAKLYGTTHGITTLEQLENVIEAENKNIDPELYQKVKDMESKLNGYEREKSFKADHERLSKDEGKTYEKLSDKAKEYATKYNVDLDTGYTLALRESVKEIVKEPDVEKIKQDAIKEYIAKIKDGYSPVESSGSSGTIVSTPKTFEDAKKGALAMFRAINNKI